MSLFIVFRERGLVVTSRGSSNPEAFLIFHILSYIQARVSKLRKLVLPPPPPLLPITASPPTHTPTRYFHTPFHTFDALIILLSFTLDVLLHGILEEVASLVVILRLWRFFKIIEEFGVGAQEQMDGLEMKIQELERENSELRGI